MIDADASPLSVVALSRTPATSVVEFPWKREAGAHLRGRRQRGRGHQPLRPRPGLEDLRVRLAGPPAAHPRRQPSDVDVLHHDLIARFDPSRLFLSAVDTLRLRLLSPASTLRLRLHDDFEVSSVSSEDGGNLLFFRVREQGSLVVSLGPHAGRTDEFSLTMRYSGRHDPSPIDHELLQIFPEPRPAYVENALVTEPPLVYSNRTAWYPRPGDEDYATLRARLDTPESLLAVTGGELVSIRTAEGRTRATYRLSEPGKYFTVVVGRLEDVGMRQQGAQMVRGFGGSPHERRDPREHGDGRGDAHLLRRALRTLPLPRREPGDRRRPCSRADTARRGSSTCRGGPPVLAGERLPEDPANFSNMPDFFLAHELAHQWWGQGVAPASYREQWLSEAWAQYSAALWVRHRKGEERLPQHARAHGAVGPSPRRGRPHPPRPAARPPQAGSRASSGRSSTTRGHGCSTCCASSWATRRSSRGARALPRAAPLRQGDHRGPARGPRGRERARPRSPTSSAGSTTRDCRRYAGRPARWRRRPATRRRSRCGHRTFPDRCRSRSASGRAMARRVRRVVLEPAGGSWTVDTADPVRDVADQRGPGDPRRDEEGATTAGASAVALAATLVPRAR